jgi:hypothetical protein
MFQLVPALGQHQGGSQLIVYMTMVDHPEAQHLLGCLVAEG